jgi:hypothetical protein
MSPLVNLDGGPFDGAEVDVSRGTTLNCEGTDVPEGYVARYTPTRDRAVYRFRGFSKVLARLSLPDSGVTPDGQ